jgi:hypothetical protein
MCSNSNREYYTADNRCERPNHDGGVKPDPEEISQYANSSGADGHLGKEHCLPAPL